MLLNYMLPILVGTGKMRSGGWVRDEFKGREGTGRENERTGRARRGGARWGQVGLIQKPSRPPSLTVPFPLLPRALFIAR